MVGLAAPTCVILTNSDGLLAAPLAAKGITRR